MDKTTHFLERFIEKGENKDTILHLIWAVDRVLYRSNFFNTLRGFEIEWLHNQNGCSRRSVQTLLCCRFDGVMT